MLFPLVKGDVHRVDEVGEDSPHENPDDKYQRVLGVV